MNKTEETIIKILDVNQSFVDLKEENAELKQENYSLRLNKAIDEMISSLNDYRKNNVNNENIEIIKEKQGEVTSLIEQIREEGFSIAVVKED